MNPAPRPAPSARPSWPVLRRRHPGIALDLGSTRTRAWTAEHGLILDVPTVTFTDATTSHPIRRGTIVDAPGTAHMLQRLLAHRLPRAARPHIVITTPVHDQLAYRAQARAAVEALRPSLVTTIPAARAITHAAQSDPTQPRLVIDIGAHLSEIVLLAHDTIHDARSTPLGTHDIQHRTLTAEQLAATLTDMAASLHDNDPTGHTTQALAHGPLLAGGGALDPDITHHLAHGLHTPLHTLPAPHTAALRGAIGQLARSHPRREGDPR